MSYRSLLLLLLVVAAGCSGGSGAEPDAGNPYDQCLGSADQTILAPYIVDGGIGPSQEFSDIFENCAKNVCSDAIVYGTEAEAEMCLAACFDTTTIAGLTTGCEECFSHSVLCGKEFCAAVCLGTSVDLCLSCVAE